MGEEDSGGGGGGVLGYRGGGHEDEVGLGGVSCKEADARRPCSRGGDRDREGGGLWEAMMAMEVEDHAFG